MVRGKSSAEIQNLFIPPDALEEIVNELTIEDNETKKK
jgi:hypothetical protein